MEGPNLLCSVDHASNPAAFCLCAGTPTFLCEKHIAEHITKQYDKPHFMYPIQAYNYSTDAPRYSRLLARLKQKNEVINEARRNISQIDTCISELRQAADKYIDRVRIHSESLSTQLLAQRETLSIKIEAAINCYESSIYDEEPKLHGLAAAMREFKGDGETLSMFEYELVGTETQPVPELVVWSVSEVDLMNPGQAIQHRPMSVNQDRLLLYGLSPSVQTEVRELNLMLDTLSRYSATMVGSENEVFLCGGINEKLAVSSTAFLIKGREVTQMSSMLIPRFCHGLFHDPDWPFLYIFGGKSSSNSSVLGLTSCERIPLSTYVPEGIPDMTHPRSVFNPCRYKQAVYLCGGFESGGSIEAYSPRANMISVVFTGLHSDVAAASGCTAVSHGDGLLIISSTKLQKWKPSTKSIDFTHDRTKSLVWSTCRQVVSAGLLLVVCSDWTLRKIRLDTGMVEEEVKPATGCGVF